MRKVYTNPKLQKRPLVYYCYTEPKVMTNTAFNLAVYLMLEHGFTPEQAAQPFICIHSLPLIGFRDATWCDPPTYTLDLVSCLRGFRKGVDACLTGHVPHRLVDDFICRQYDELDDPGVLNMNQVSACVCVCVTFDVEGFLDLNQVSVCVFVCVCVRVCVCVCVCAPHEYTHTSPELV
jgi:hypothetical protein